MTFKYKLNICIFIITVLTTSTSISGSGPGIVVFSLDTCGYYIVQSEMGMSVLEWFGGVTPVKGDTLIGDFNTYGFVDLYDISQSSSTRAWVEEFMLSKSEALERMMEKCN
ncbi:MAG: hypothetical protein D6732_19635 [Methanobacteriota archaeon]|nr:MAG: hypothetical protein D6732_19635 [Euryarchaeota archaeon]